MSDKDKKIRLDKVMTERRLASSRERARALILSGSVVVNETTVDKAGQLVSVNADIRIRGDQNPYVSRGGLKLKHALETFRVDVAGSAAMDVGASTGGFTDCLLQEGARIVYAVDVGYGQLAWKIRMDERVRVLERTNIRYFDGRGIDEPIDIVTVDVSFISLRLVVPALYPLLPEGARLLALIKPQFEAHRSEIGKGGVVKDREVHDRVVDEIAAVAEDRGFRVAGLCESPLLGPAGNREFFIYAHKCVSLRRGVSAGENESVASQPSCSM